MADAPGADGHRLGAASPAWPHVCQLRPLTLDAAVQHGGDAARPGKVPPADGAPDHVVGVVAGKFGGAEQPGQRAPFAVLAEPLPVLGRQQLPDRFLVSSDRAGAGYVSPDRRQAGGSGPAGACARRT